MWSSNYYCLIWSISQAFIKRCLTYRKELRPDVVTISEDPYLKPKKTLASSGHAGSPGPTSLT